MDGYLTTHVLDTARGLPAAGIKISLFHLNGEQRHKICDMMTNDDGRTDTPILPKNDFKTGSYELEFHAGAYLRTHKMIHGGSQFLDIIPIRFEMGDSAHYHVPLLLSGYGYSTYRGS